MRRSLSPQEQRAQQCVREQRQGLRGGRAGLFGSQHPRVLGPIATRARMNTNKFAGTTPWMARTAFFARDDITDFTAAWGSWYVPPGGPETALGGTLTIAASLEYPAGNFQQLLFGGASSFTIPNGQTKFCDLAHLTTVVPRNSQGWLRFLATPSAFVPFQNGPLSGVTPWFAGGDAWHFPGTDQTLSGTVTDSGTGSSMWPLAMLGLTNRRTLGFIGDSRVQGINDLTMQSPGDSGEFERPFGPSYAYINASVRSESMLSFLNSHALRLPLLLTANTIICNYGINDFLGGESAAQLEANLVSGRALFPQQQFYGATIVQLSTGAWTLADGSDQTVSVINPTLVQVNTDYRAHPAGFSGVMSGFFELCDVQSLGFPPTENSGKWKANGAPSTYTQDGVHETTFANQLYSFALPPW